MILFFLLLLIFIGLYILLFKENDNDICYTDFILANDPKYAERLKLGNWQQSTYRAIGTTRPFYNPGDDVYIYL
jgi:hypothetical protein